MRPLASLERDAADREARRLGGSSWATIGAARGTALSGRGFKGIERRKMYDTAKLRRLQRSLARLARTRYPAFLFGGAVAPAEIPVFTYHDVGADALRDDLQFLERNGYGTVGLDAFHEFSIDGSPARHKCVLLTFDDARRNFWDVAFPVLREHGARAALFVPSFWIGGGSVAGADAAATRGFMTWEQLAHCDRAGFVDVESHAHRHALVCTSERLVGFASPESLAHYDLFDWPMRHERGADVSGRPAAGTPVYESRPILSADRRVLEPPAAADACRRLVEAEGGAAFFVRPKAVAELRAAHAAAIARGGPAERLPESEFLRQLESELRLAVECFERELGRKPRYFAYPWMLGSEQSLELLAGLGMTAAFGVALDFRRARQGHGPLPIYGRYKSDWLQFLPGRGRKRLRHVLPQKVATFIASQHLAH
jgi:peptidoglycan/xylan/chitin deacetylase (PgdA/CDA1 family)